MKDCSFFSHISQANNEKTKTHGLKIKLTSLKIKPVSKKKSMNLQKELEKVMKAIASLVDNSQFIQIKIRERALNKSRDSKINIFLIRHYSTIENL